jgi:hypothetical protein
MVYIAKKKDGSAVFHTDLNAMKEIDGIDKPDMTVTEAEFEAADGLIRVINGKITLGKTKAEKQADAERNVLLAEQEALQRDLVEKDYKVIKAAEAGISLAQADPELHVQREQKRARISEIRERLSQLENTA